MKFPTLSLILSIVPLVGTVSSEPGWRFNLKNQTSGIVALESIVVSPTLALFFDRASDDPLQINGHSAWGALWNLESNNVTALNVITNSFCAAGAMLSNGTMVSLCDSDFGLSADYPTGKHRRRPNWLSRESRYPAREPSHPPLRPVRVAHRRGLYALRGSRHTQTHCEALVPVGHTYL